MKLGTAVVLATATEAAQGAFPASVLQERAQRRKEAIEFISGIRSNDQRANQSFHRIQGRNRQKRRILHEARNIFEGKLRMLSKTIPATRANEQEKSSNSQLKNDETFKEPDSSSYSSVPDLGILPSSSKKELSKILKNKVQKFVDAANLQRPAEGSSSDLSGQNFLPDLGIISSKMMTRRGQNTMRKGNRHMEEGTFTDDMFEDIGYDNFFANTMTIFCDSLKASELAYAAASLTGNAPFCETCQVTFDDGSDPESKYSVELNCPNIPFEDEYKDEAFSGFSEFCSYDFCQTCDVDADNFAVSMKGCSVDLESALIDYYASDSNNNNSNNNDSNNNNGISNTGINNSTFTVEEVKGAFDYYFGCDVQGDSCCSSTISDDATSFSFQFNCPSKLNAADNGFGYYLVTAQKFCQCPSRSGVKCSRCDVNPWEATVDIEGCVLIDKEEEIPPCANLEIPLKYIDDETAFIEMYSEYCFKEESKYLQDAIVDFSCDCAFDESTQTATFSCQYQEKCREFSSYCPEKPIDFCENYRFSGSWAKDSSASFRRCVSITSPHEFSYCVDYGIAENSADNALGCEMEVDGIKCASCSLNDVSSYLQYNTLLAAMGSVNYDCSNTVIGTHGPGVLASNALLDNTLSYFIYKTLPCSGGCDLCGVGEMNAQNSGPKNNFMTKPDGTFSSEIWKDGKEERCFDGQLDAMVGNQILSSDECQALRESVRDNCGCKNPNVLPSSAHFVTISAMGTLVLVMSAASIFHTLLA